ncbi:MAG TPA: response regulator transcription factor [Verrucomicrobiota bacterium]|nr:response regulator transcription factor [Verrucomicrobiota bacterium]HNT14422.1 response regulator transcription factor [Verrucomicrobiota bacterium]
MSVGKKKIKVLIVDDHPVVRKGLMSCLANKEHLKIVGEASNGPEAIKLTTEQSPDVVLMDVSMPGMDGQVVTEALRKEAPQVKVLILSMQSSREPVLRLIRAGARGYVLKDAPPDELISAIEAVHAGEAYFSKPVAQIALNQYISDADDTKPVAKLSEREREVLALIAEGKSNKEIAVHLGIGVRTTETHRERIMRKLGIHSVAGLTKFAIANGISSLEESDKP